MEVREETAAEVAEASVRAAVYRLLAGSLIFPTESNRRFLQAEVFPLLRATSFDSPALDEAIKDVVATQAVSQAELRRSHSHVFTHIDNPDCPAYESAYCPGGIFRQADVMADVAGFYRAHGLVLGERERERLDHIATEFEFMSLLARKQAYALLSLTTEAVDECVRSQRHFLRDHVGVWAVAFAQRLQVHAADSPYEAVGRLTQLWLADELKCLDAQPTTSWSEPQPMPDLDDGSCGSAADVVGVPVELRGR
jgi:TorA maturation chaperone TorD